MFYRYATAAFVAVLPASMAFAVPATDEGAARIKTAIETYISATPGVVTVTPTGESYELTLDGKPLLNLLAMAVEASGGSPESKPEFSLSPMKYQLIDNGDGTWKISTDQEVEYKFSFEGLEQSARFHQKSNGIFDEAIMGLRANEGVLSNYQIASRQQIPDFNFDENGQSNSSEFSTDTQNIERLEYSMTGQANPAGGVDYKGTFSANGSVQKAEYPESSFMQFMSYELQMPVQEGTFDLKGMRNPEILGLLGFFIAHPSEDAIKADQEALRQALEKALPLWDDVSAQFKGHDLKLKTVTGEFTAKEIGVDFGLSGLSANGRLAETIRVTGATIPPKLAPEWSTVLIPTDLDIGMSVTGFDLLAPAKKMIAAFDLNDEFDPMSKLDEGALMQAFLPKGNFKVALGDGFLKGKDYNITYSGDMTVDPNSQMPRGKARVTATGLDNVEEALAAGPQDQVGDTLMLVRMARGLARPGAVEGEQVWDIDATSADGVIKVNDMPMTEAKP